MLFWTTTTTSKSVTAPNKGIKETSDQLQLHKILNNWNQAQPYSWHQLQFQKGSLADNGTQLHAPDYKCKMKPQNTPKCTQLKPHRLTSAEWLGIVSREGKAGCKKKAQSTSDRETPQKTSLYIKGRGKSSNWASYHYEISCNGLSYLGGSGEAVGLSLSTYSSPHEARHLKFIETLSLKQFIETKNKTCMQKQC